MTRSNARNARRFVARKGFTLTEVLLVLAILGVIAAMVVPNLIGQQQKAMVKTTRMSVKSLEDACQQYAIDHDGEYPAGGRDEVLGLLTNPGVDAHGKTVPPYLKKIPTDAWGQALYYQWPNNNVPNATTPALWSSGPDKKSDEGQNDDVNNWSDK
ncbi:MAG TPA: type II secretion system major pseudopilin GspG [Schlesneria sp.]